MPANPFPPPETLDPHMVPAAYRGLLAPYRGWRFARWEWRDQSEHGTWPEIGVTLAAPDGNHYLTVWLSVVLAAIEHAPEALTTKGIPT